MRTIIVLLICLAVLLLLSSKVAESPTRINWQEREPYFYQNVDHVFKKLGVGKKVNVLIRLRLPKDSCVTETEIYNAEQRFLAGFEINLSKDDTKKSDSISLVHASDLVPELIMEVDREAVEKIAADAEVISLEAADDIMKTIISRIFKGTRPIEPDCIFDAR